MRMDNQAFSCPYDGCHKSFRRRDRLDIHARTHTGERPFVCIFAGCKNSYARSQHLSRHISRVHTSGYKEQLKIKCPHCNQELADSTSLKRHVQRCHENKDVDKSYKCHEEGCNQSFHKKKQLVAHRYQHVEHPDYASRCWRCQYEGCGKAFAFPNKLKCHMKVHQGYPCDSEGCTKVLPNWSSLRKHKADEHAPIHSCNTCGMVFKQKSNLTQHIKIHATSREPLTCPRDSCGRIFFYKRNLSQHIKEFHEGETSQNRKRKRSSATPQNKVKKLKKRTFADRLCGVNNKSESQPSHQDEIQHSENESEEIAASVQNRATHLQVEQSELHPHVVQADLHPQVVQSELHPQVVQSELHPQAVQAELNPQAIQSELHPHVVQAELNPQAVQLELHPQAVQAELNPQAEQSELNLPQSETGTEYPPGAQIYQQIITASGQIESIPIHLTPQQLENLQLELEKKLGRPSSAASMQHTESQIQLSHSRMV